MKNTLDAYIRFLSNFLSRNNYPEAEGLSFINARADQAYEVFWEARRGGVDVPTAEELAAQVKANDIAVLTLGRVSGEGCDRRVEDSS